MADKLANLALSPVAVNAILRANEKASEEERKQNQQHLSHNEQEPQGPQGEGTKDNDSGIETEAKQRGEESANTQKGQNL